RYGEEARGHKLQKFTPDGRFVASFGESGQSEGQFHRPSSVEEWQTRISSNLMPPLPPYLNTPYHISSQTEPYFWGPVSVTLDRENRLYVPETNRYRVQIYQKI